MEGGGRRRRVGVTGPRCRQHGWRPSGLPHLGACSPGFPDPCLSSIDVMYDTIIIGAGMSGLAAGIRLAHYDQRVCILERHYTIGGLNSFYRLRGRDYDVGLHAITNYSPGSDRRSPLARLLRQLRFRWEDFALAPQVGSTIAFPGVQLRFGNGLELLRSEIARAFPEQKQAFERLLTEILDYDDLGFQVHQRSAREVLGEILHDPLLVEMLLCPLMWYGNAREHDMDFGQFCIMFRGIFMEGLARPLAGVRLILKKLVRRYRELGGELRLRSGVDRIHIENDRVAGRGVGRRHATASSSHPLVCRMAGNPAVARRYRPSGQRPSGADVIYRIDFGARRRTASVGP